MGAPPASVRQPRQDRARHGSRVSHPVAALCRVSTRARPVLYCEDESILAAPFYLMERRRGVILAGRTPVDRPSRPDLVVVCAKP